MNFVYARSHHIVRLFMQVVAVVVKCNSHIIGVTMASSYVVLKYTRTTSKIQKCKHSGTYIWNLLHAIYVRFDIPHPTAFLYNLSPPRPFI